MYSWSTGNRSPMLKRCASATNTLTIATDCEPKSKLRNPEPKARESGASEYLRARNDQDVPGGANREEGTDLVTHRTGTTSPISARYRPYCSTDSECDRDFD